MNGRVLGVDGCRGGWVGIAWGADGSVVAYARSRISELVEAAEADGSVDVIAVDIPIGLPERGRRKADAQARLALGARRSSLFMTPVRAAVVAPDHRTASAINRELAGEGISVQAFMLAPKILEAALWVERGGATVIEVHPELSFAAIAGGPLSSRKSTWVGAVERHRLLGSVGLVIDDRLTDPGAAAGVDDVLDAGAAAWTARRYTNDDAVSRPDPPERLDDGTDCAIWT